jgi:hypothetical protein
LVDAGPDGTHDARGSAAAGLAAPGFGDPDDGEVRGRVGAAANRTGLLGHGVGVGLDGVDLPRLIARSGDPDLVLDGVAACGVFLGGGSSPAAARRLVAALTSSVVSTSTPR